MARRRRDPDFDYQTYLASREWSLLREQVRKRSNNTCEHCYRAPQQAVHHLSYANIGHEKLGDLLAICNPCHAFVSGKGGDNPLLRWAIVTPPITFPAWESLGYSPDHYIIPCTDAIMGNELTASAYGFQVRAHFCRGANCIWCGYSDANWPLYINYLEFRPPWEKANG